MVKKWLFAGAVATALMVGGCTSTAAPSGSSAIPTTAETSSEPDFSSLAPYPSGHVDEDSGETYNPVTPAQWDAGSRAEATKAAETAMTAFARHDLSREDWWANLSPLLTSTAQDAYAYVVPESVPARKVTGPAAITDDGSALVAVIEVPTDVGLYSITVNRADGDAPWQVARLTPPDGIR